MSEEIRRVWGKIGVEKVQKGVLLTQQHFDFKVFLLSWKTAGFEHHIIFLSISTVEMMYEKIFKTLVEKMFH